jgi:hypothetical protein
VCGQAWGQLSNVCDRILPLPLNVVCYWSVTTSIWPRPESASFHIVFRAWPDDSRSTNVRLVQRVTWCDFRRPAAVAALGWPAWHFVIVEYLSECTHERDSPVESDSWYRDRCRGAPCRCDCPYRLSGRSHSLSLSVSPTAIRTALPWFNATPMAEGTRTFSFAISRFGA